MHANRRFLELAERLFVRRPALGEELGTLLPPRPREQWLAALERAQRGQPSTIEFVAEQLPKSPVFELRVGPLVDEAGEVLGATLSGREVTRERHHERSSALATHILERVVEGVSLVRDADGVIVFANPAFERMFGYGPGELTGLPVSVLNAPTERSPADVAGELLAALRAAGSWRGELLNQRRDGSTFWTRASVTSSTHPEHGPVWLTVQHDATEQRRIEGLLREAEQRFSAILEHAPLLLSAKDLEGRVLFVSRSFEQLEGPPLEQYVGRSVFELFPREVAEQLWSNDRAALEAARLLTSEERVRHRDGRWHTYQTVKFPLLDAAGRAFAVAAISADITERLAAEEERRALVGQLHESQKLESLGVLAGGIAHDINNLLVPILSWGEVLQSESKDPSALGQAAQQIDAAARQIRDLVLQMLAFAGKGHLSMRPVDLVRLSEDQLPLLRASLRKNLSIELQCASPSLWIEGDAGRLRQVLMNLVLNARDALGEGPGCVRLSLGREPRPGGSGVVLLEVADDGPGIPPEVLPRIFEPFFTTKETGRGLGLSAVQGIVRSHHGELRVDTQPGRGTTFRLCFPECPPEVAPAAPSPPSAAAPLLSLRVLIVDDEEPVRRVLEFQLRHAGAAPQAVSSGEEAYALVSAAPGGFDAVLLDFTMPGWSGEQTCLQLRQVDPALPIIVMSGWASGSGFAPGLLRHVTSVLPKPFRAEQLRRILEGLPRRSG